MTGSLQNKCATLDDEQHRPKGALSTQPWKSETPALPRGWERVSSPGTCSGLPAFRETYSNDKICIVLVINTVFYLLLQCKSYNLVPSFPPVFYIDAKKKNYIVLVFSRVFCQFLHQHPLIWVLRTQRVLYSEARSHRVGHSDCLCA